MEKIFTTDEDGNHIAVYVFVNDVITIADKDGDIVQMTRDEAIAAARAILAHYKEPV